MERTLMLMLKRLNGLTGTAVGLARLTGCWAGARRERGCSRSVWHEQTSLTLVNHDTDLVSGGILSWDISVSHLFLVPCSHWPADRRLPAAFLEQNRAVYLLPEELLGSHPGCQGSPQQSARISTGNFCRNSLFRSAGGASLPRHPLETPFMTSVLASEHAGLRADSHSIPQPVAPASYGL